MYSANTSFAASCEYFDFSSRSYFSSSINRINDKEFDYDFSVCSIFKTNGHEENYETQEDFENYKRLVRADDEDDTFWEIAWDFVLKAWDYIYGDINENLFNGNGPFLEIFDTIGRKIDDFKFTVNKIFEDLSIERQFYDFANDFKEMFTDDAGYSLIQRQYDSLKSLLSLTMTSNGSLSDLSTTINKTNSTLSLINFRLLDIYDMLLYFLGDPFDFGYYTLEELKEFDWKYYNDILKKLDSIEFDYDKLKDTLEKLDFSGEGGLGGVIKQLIKSISDIIMSTIENFASVIESVLNNLTDSIVDILDFLNSLLDKIIHLIVPENLDFIDSSFTNISDKLKLKFSFAFDFIASFKALFSQQSRQFEDVEIKGVSTTLYNKNLNFPNSNLPLSKLNLIGQYFKPFLNAFILLWFLIDMYRWIHERGAVIE